MSEPPTGNVTNRELYEALNGLGEALRDEMRLMRGELLDSLRTYRASATCDERHKALDAELSMFRRVACGATGVATSVIIGLLVYIWQMR